MEIMMLVVGSFIRLWKMSSRTSWRGWSPPKWERRNDSSLKEGEI
jgi:hypothetical protein